VSGLRTTLESPQLRRILVAYTINRLGTWFGYVALSVAVFAHTHSALGVAALLVTGQALPAVLVPALVARVEASSRRSRLSALYAFETVATLALAGLLWHFWLPAILVLVALDGTAALAASALLRAEAARVAAIDAGEPAASASRAPEERSDAAKDAERAANAALNIAFSSTFVMGPALAGLVVAAAGGPEALLIDAASFLICAGMLLGMSPHVEEAEGGVRARLSVAWRHIREVPALRGLLVAESVALVFFAADASIEVPYAKATLHAGDRGYGLLLTVWGVGAAIGSLGFARSARRPIGVMLSAGTVAVGLAYVGFALAPSLGVACLAGVLGGAGNGVQWASLISAVQQLTPPHLHARMMGAVEAINALFPALGLILGGALTAASSTRTAFLVVGLGAVAMTVAFVRLALSSTLGQPRDPRDRALRGAREEARGSVLAEPVSVDRADL
jgi:predicted MFS family arabinose efflux permease